MTTPEHEGREQWTAYGRQSGTEGKGKWEHEVRGGEIRHMRR